VPLAREPVERGTLLPLLSEYNVSDSVLHVVLPTATFVPTRVALLRDHLVRWLEKELAASARSCAEHRTKASRAARSAKPERKARAGRRSGPAPAAR
jgi:hypothetical protein